MKHFDWQTVNQNIQGKKSLEDGRVLVPKVKLSQILPDPDQPRKQAESSEVESLAQSIKEVGLIHLITCFKRKDGKYQIVSGERRFWALKKAGKKQTDIILVEENEVKKKKKRYLAIQLIENLARKNLNPLEEANCLNQLLVENGYEQKTLAQKLGKSASYITRSLNALKILPEIQEEMIGSPKKISQEVYWIMGEISQRHQLKIWKKLQDNPTITRLKEMREKLKSGNKAKKEETSGPKKPFTYQPQKSKWIKKISLHRAPKNTKEIDELIDELVNMRDQIKKSARDYSR